MTEYLYRLLVMPNIHPNPINSKNIIQILYHRFLAFIELDMNLLNYFIMVALKKYKVDYLRSLLQICPVEEKRDFRVLNSFI